jgi:hypothetical protein
MRTSHLNQGVCMLPLTERLKFERRYSSICGLFFCIAFAHGDVLEFF